MPTKLEFALGNSSQVSGISFEHMPSSANAGLVRANSVLPPVVLVPPAPPAPELVELVPPAPAVVLPVVALPVVLPVVALAVVTLSVVEALPVLELVAVVADAVVVTVLVTLAVPTVLVCVAVPVVVPGAVVALALSVEFESSELHAVATTNANETREAEPRKL